MLCFRHLFESLTRKSSARGQTSLFESSDQWTSDGLIPDSYVHHINDLPNEMLIRILEFLDFKSQMKTQLVCKRWYRLIESKLRIVSDLTLTDFCRNYSSYSRTSSHIIMKEIKKKIRLEKSYRKIFSAIVSKHFGIDSLYLNFSDTRIQNNVLKLLANCCDTDLRLLSVRFYDRKVKFEATDVDLFCHKFPNIEVFRVETYKLFVEQQSIDQMIRIWQSLDTFIVRNICVKDKGKYKRELYSGVSFREVCPSIRVIKTSGHIFDTMAFMYLQLKQIKSIQCFSITSVDDIRNVQIFCKSCPDIVRLCLSFAKTYTQDEAIDMWTAISLLEKLEKLDLLLHPCDSIVCDNCIKNLENCPHLTSLSIRGAQMSAEAVEMLVKCCPQLIKITLLYVNFMVNSDESIAPIGRLQNLEKLQIMTNPSINDQTIVDLMKNCPELRYINLSRVKTLSANTLTSMIQLAKSCPQQYFQINVWHKLRPKLKDMESQIPHNLFVRYV